MSGDKPEKGSDQPIPNDPVHQAYGVARGRSAGGGDVVYGGAADLATDVYLSSQGSYLTGYFSTAVGGGIPPITMASGSNVTRDKEEIRRLLNDPLFRLLSDKLNEEAKAIKVEEDQKAEEEIRQLWDKMDKDIVELEARADRLLSALTR